MSEPNNTDEPVGGAPVPPEATTLMDDVPELPAIESRETRVLDADDTRLVGEAAAPNAPLDEAAASGETDTLPMPAPGPRPDEASPAAAAPGAARDSSGDCMASQDEVQTDVPLADRQAKGTPRSVAEAFRRIPRRTAVALLAVAVVALIAAVALSTYNLQLWGGKPIPDVTGAPVADATARLEDRGLSVVREDVPTDEGAGTVLGMDPAAGARLSRGDAVTVRVGVPRVVPDVVGLSLDEAKARLSDAGIGQLRLEYKNSDEDEGSVTGVSPARGSVVTADEEVALQVAQPFTVPDVIGLGQDEATRIIGEAGLESKIEWREAEGTALSVLATSPAAGERASSGATVTVTVVAPGASSETHLADYLSSKPRDVSSYLSWKGWAFEFGEVRGAGGEDIAETAWTKSGVGRLVFTDEPESSRHGVFLGSLFTSDVLAQGASIAGVRFEPELSGDDADSAADSATVNAWALRCGLTGLRQTLAADDVAELAGVSARGSRGIVGYGEMGDDAWAVAVKDSDVVVIVAPKALYDDIDLGNYGDSLAGYLGSELLLG